MKKNSTKLAAWAATISVICTSMASGVVSYAEEAGEPTVNTPEYSVDFEDNTSGTITSGVGGWTIPSTTTATVQKEDGNSYLELTTDKANDRILYSKGDVIKKDADFTVSYRIKFDFSGTPIPTDKLQLTSGTVSGYDTWVYNKQFQYQKSLTSTNDKTTITNVFENDTWYNIRWVFDSSKATGEDKTITPVTVYIEDKLGGKYQVFARSNNAVNNVDAVSWVLGATTSKVCIDDIKVYTGKVIPEIKSEIFDYSFDGFAVTSVNDNGVGTVTAETEKNVSSIDVNNMASADNAKTVTGKFGKSTSDESLYMNNAVSTSGKDTYLQIKPVAESKLLNTGDSQTFTFNCAFDENLRDISINGNIYSENTSGAVSSMKYGGGGKVLNDATGVSEESGVIMTLTPTQLKAMGTNTATITPALVPNKWYTVTLNVTMGEEGTANKFSVFIDDKKIFDNADANGLERISYSPLQWTSLGNFYGFASLWMNYNWSSTTTKYFETPGGIYFDDLSLVSNFNGATYTEPSKADFSTDNESDNRWISNNYTVYADATSTPADFKAKYGDANVSNIIFRNAQGEAVSDETAIGDCTYGVISTTDGSERYLNLVGKNTTQLTQTGAIETMNNYRTAGGWSNNKGTVIATAQNGLGGKSADDESIAIVPATEAIGYLDYAFVADSALISAALDLYGPVTYTGNVLIPASVNSGSLELKMRMTNGTFQRMMKFEDGNIFGISSDIKLGTYNPGEWNSFSITHFPGKGINLRVNGETERFIIMDTYVGVTALRYELTTNDNVYLDNVKLVSGYNADNASAPSIASKENDIAVDNGLIKLTTDYNDITVSELLQSLTLSADVIKVFDDNTYVNEIGASDYIDDGVVFALCKDNIYKYYTVKYVFSCVQIDGTAAVTGPADNGQSLYIGVYDSSDNLLRATAGMIADGVVSANVSTTDGTYIKTFLWNNDMVPAMDDEMYTVQ